MQTGCMTSTLLTEPALIRSLPEVARLCHWKESRGVAPWVPRVASVTIWE